MTINNDKIFEWINAQKDWKLYSDLWTVMIMKPDGKPEILLSDSFEDAWKYMEQNKEKVLYFFKQFKAKKS